MKTIHRWNVPSTTGANAAEMPIGAEIVSVGPRGSGPDSVSFWAQVDTDADMEERRFIVSGTGHAIPQTRDSDADLAYLGTVPYVSAGLVWHLWEIPQGAALVEQTEHAQDGAVAA